MSFYTCGGNKWHGLLYGRMYGPDVAGPVMSEAVQ